VAGDTVWLEPGTYGSGSGETFPLALPSGVSVQGLESHAVTHIDAGGENFPVRLAADSALRGVTLRNTGTWSLWNQGSAAASASVVDCAFVGGQSVAGGTYTDFIRCRFSGQTRRVLAPYGMGQRLIDCEIVGTPNMEAVSGSYAYYDNHSGSVEILRTTIRGCRLAVYFAPGNSISLSLIHI